MKSQKEFFVYHDPESTQHKLYEVGKDSGGDGYLVDLGPVDQEAAGRVFYNPSDEDFHMSLYRSSEDLDGRVPEIVEHGGREELEDAVEHILGEIRSEKNFTNRAPEHGRSKKSNAAVDPETGNIRKKGNHPMAGD